MGIAHTVFIMTEAVIDQCSIISNNICNHTVIGLNLGRLQYREDIDDPEVLDAKLTGLLPETNYRVHLAASTAQGQGEPIFLDAVTSPPGRKFEKLRFFVY